jgi:hypothetical protein
MPWVRFDDTFPINRKVDGLSDAAFRLHVSAIFWCARNLTDGFVPEDDLELVCARVRTPARFAAQLVDRQLWHERPGGWQIKDYLEFQPSKEKVLEEREKSAERQRKWRESHRNGGSHAVSNGGTNAAPSRPAPSLKRGGGGEREFSRRAPTPNDNPTSPSDDTREKARGRDLAISACDMCDDRGYRGRTICDHDPNAEERNQRGSALVRAAMRGEVP